MTHFEVVNALRAPFAFIDSPDFKTLQLVEYILGTK